MSKTVTEVIYDHLEKREKGLVEEDIEENFSPDIIILSEYGVFRGHDGVLQSSAKLNKDLGEDKNSTFDYTNTLIETDFAILEWTGESDKRTITDGFDAYFVKDGKIVFQAIHYTVINK